MPELDPRVSVKRRNFVALLCTAVIWPLAVHAQPSATPVVGYLGAETPERMAARLQAFRQGLADTGYVEGRNVTIEYRWAEGRNDRLPELAADLVRREVNVLAAPGSLASALAAKAATPTIPIVFETGADPVALGLVASLNRPGGNITGVTSLNAEVGPKRLELLHELLPAVTEFALLVNPTNPRNAEVSVKDLLAAAQVRRLKLHVLNAGNEHELEEVFAGLRRLPVGGVVIANETFFANRGELIAALALRHAVPAVHQREFAKAGGLIGVGGVVSQSHGQAGVYAGRILKGEKPADLPVQRATKVELVINLKTANALGLAVPPTLLARADEVIE
jgi:putative tryptophan/tyrosine transport system substrate-binding protein